MPDAAARPLEQAKRTLLPSGPERDARQGGLWRPPSGPDIQALPGGIWWDALKVPAYLGPWVLAGLGKDTGAVIHDPYGQHLYWLTQAGATDEWNLMYVQPLGTATYVGVPPPHRTEGPGVHWIVPLTVERYLTEPGRLYAVLTEAVEAVPRPPITAICCGCGNTTMRPVEVLTAYGKDYACPYCALDYEPGTGPRDLVEAARPYRPEEATR